MYVAGGRQRPSAADEDFVAAAGSLCLQLPRARQRRVLVAHGSCQLLCKLVGQHAWRVRGSGSAVRAAAAGRCVESEHVRQLLSMRM